MRYVVDPSVVLRWLEDGAEPPSEHSWLAPTLLRSEVLAALYGAARQGELSEKEGLARLDRFSAMKIRYLGDRVLRRQAWKVADRLDWDATLGAEYVAMVQLQADALVTLDARLADGAAGLVATAAPEDVL